MYRTGTARSRMGAEQINKIGINTILQETRRGARGQTQRGGRLSKFCGINFLLLASAWVFDLRLFMVACHCIWLQMCGIGTVHGGTWIVARGIA